MKNKILFLMFLVLLVPLVASQTYKQSTDIDLKVPFEVNGAAPSGSATCNITIIYPNSTTLKKDSPMTSSSGGIFNITLSKEEIVELGEYEWTAFCCDGSNCAAGYDTFEITPSGTKPTTAQGIIYFIGMGLVFILFMMSLYGAIVLPWRNGKNEEGKIVSLNDLKYVKLALWYITFLLFVFFLAIAKGMAGDFLFQNNIYVLFNTLYTIFLVLIGPVTIVSLWITIAQVFADKKTYAFLSRGLSGR